MNSSETRGVANDNFGRHSKVFNLMRKWIEPAVNAVNFLEAADRRHTPEANSVKPEGNVLS